MTCQFVSTTMMLWTCLSLVHSLFVPYTIPPIALKGIHRIMFGEEIARIRKLGVQGVSYQGHSSVHTANIQLLFQALNFLTVIASGLMMWKGLCLVTNSESPIVVVLSYVSWELRGHHELTR
jgi:hypothetical protein